MRPALRFALLCAAGAVVAALGGCSPKGGDPDLVAGKKLFVQKCGSCHILARAGTKGTIGPDLDESLRRPVQDGFGDSAVRAMVREQIHIPRHERTEKPGTFMPADLVTGQSADDVASYVAKVVSRGGKDTGLLATAVQTQQSNKPAVEKAGKLDIPADPNGQLAFTFKTAEAKAGQLTLEMPNKSGVPHDITIDGKGKGEVVSNGVSSFSAKFAAGSYTFYCSVPGHKEAGMVGKLTVK